MKIKKQLYQECLIFVENKLTNIQQTIRSNQEALASETKSSAGDKHETGRAMLQLEMEKAGQQLKIVNEMKLVLEQIDISNKSKVCKLGSLVKTDKVNYFLAISAGQLTVSGNTYFAVSSQSPIGKMLIGKRVNDTINFNGNSFIIESVL